MNLGFWREKSEMWTWAGWVQVKRVPDVGELSEIELVTAKASGEFDWRLSWRDGGVVVRLDALCAGTKAPEQRVHMKMASNRDLALGQWVRLAFTSERGIHRLFVNGIQVAETTTAQPTSIQLANVILLSHWMHDNHARILSGQRPEVLFDVVAMWDRALSATEVAGWAGSGRGVWSHMADRQGLAVAWWHWGKMLIPVAFTLLASLSAVCWLGMRSGWLAEELPRPSLRPAILVAVVGMLVTAGAATWSYRVGRRADKAAFNELLERRKSDLDGFWQHLAGLGLRARDWLEAHPNPTPETWAEWLSVNHFPHDYYGLVGIGYAEQVLPETRKEQEAKWAARHNFGFRVLPADARPSARPIRELDGHPLLPVVLYQPATGDLRQWQTTGGLLGRDLLYSPSSDRRGWSESHRVEESVARNEITSSSVEELWTVNDGTFRTFPGLLLYVPLTWRNKHDDNGTLAPKDWRGVVFLCVDFNAVVNDVLHARPALAGFRMFTGGMAGQYHDLVLDTGRLLPEAADRPEAYQRAKLEVPHYQHRLWLEFWSTPEFEERSTRSRPWWILGGGSSLAALMATLLFVQIRAREAQARMVEQLRAANTDLYDAYRERERLSRDLHDGSIQNFYGLGLHLQRVRTLLDTAPDRARAELTDSLAMLDQSIEELRKFILTSNVDNLQQRTLVSALESLVNRLRRTAQIEMELHLDEKAAAIDPSVGVQVLNMVRETVSNALRHANAQRIEVRLERAETDGGSHSPFWRLSIVDDGCGFEVARVNGLGRGLKNLATRAMELGGRSHVVSAPGSGTRAVVEFPG